MPQQLENIKKSFHIIPEVLKERAEVGLYIESLASVIVERFYEHFLENPEFAGLIKESELPDSKECGLLF